MELQGSGKILFITMMQAALHVKQLGHTEQEWMEFSKGIWETLEINGADEMGEVVAAVIVNDLNKYMTNGE